MPADDKPKVHRLGDVRPDWLTTGARKPKPENTPDVEVEAPWAKPAKPPSKLSRIWSLSWVSVLSIFAVLTVIVVAIHAGQKAPSRPQEPSLPFLRGTEKSAAITDALSGFLSAATSEERCAHVLEPERVSPLVEEYYAREGLPQIEFKRIEQLHFVLLNGHPWAWAEFVDGEGRSHLASFKQTARSYLMDWESFVAYGELSWETLLAERPSKPVQMRVYLSHSDYRNFKYSSRERFVGFKVEPREGGPELYGFAERDTRTDVLLFAVVAPGMRQPVNVRLRFEPDAGADNLVVIDEVIHRQWTPPSISASEPLH